AENLTLGITVQHLGNAKDNITITCLNAEDLARAGWRAEWVPASGWKVENASAVSDEMNPGDLKEARLSLFRLRADADAQVVARIVARFGDDHNTIDVLEITTPRPSADASDLSVSGGPVTFKSPVEEYTEAAGIAAGLVSLTLVIYYVARRRRWVK
ncbi:MAG: hypothetical protein AB1665_07335, partial [Candidatus Thermoplasmatota archaeon]